MKKTLSIIAALAVFTSQTNAAQAGCLSIPSVSFTIQTYEQAGAEQGDQNFWGQYDTNAYIWVQWNTSMTSKPLRNAQVNRWLVDTSGRRFNNTMALVVGVKSLPLAKHYYPKCDPAIIQAGIEIIVFEMNTTNVVERVTSTMSVNNAG